uniref:Mitochondrial ribosomal protein S21 n=1 Tax=Panthera leo TaxID=9689 RepID=A0A8C8WT14_PANLE
MAKHLKFIARTVMIQEGNVEGAYRTLNGILTMDGLIEDIKRRRYYEKPCRRRQRGSYEICWRIHNMEMARSSNFLMPEESGRPMAGLLRPVDCRPSMKIPLQLSPSYLNPIFFSPFL